MADSRELEFRILTKAETRGLEDTQRALEDVQRAGADTTRDLDKVGASLDDMSDDAKRAAREMDASFDKIGRSSRDSSDDVDRSSRESSSSLREFGDEAGGTAREVAASFTGSGSDILGGFQELAANAGNALGPIGVAAGVAAAAGVGLITAQQEKLKQMTADLVQDMIDAGGTLNEEAVNARIFNMATEDLANFTKYNDEAERLGLNIDDITRARAGDLEAIGRVQTALGELDAANAASMESTALAQKGPRQAMVGLRGELQTTVGAYEQAASAVGQATSATASDTESATKQSSDAWAGLRNDLGKPIKAKVDISGPTQAQLNAIRRGIVQGVGPVVLNPPRIPAPIFYRTTP